MRESVENSGACECSIPDDAQEVNGENICYPDCQNSIECAKCVTPPNGAGVWYGDCYSCNDGYHRQQDVYSCMTQCPTGFAIDIDTNHCFNAFYDPVSVVFDSIATEFYGDPTGTFTAGPRF